ncbi:MAG: endopeptidase La [Bacteriodetes bacterium]|nr:endopeptidase La [Bacteroidota bacterium]
MAKKATSSAKKKSVDKTNHLTVLPLRDVIIYPHMIFPVLIGRASSLRAVTEALERDKLLFVSAQADASVDEPKIGDVYEYGTVAKIMQVLRLPNQLLKVLVEGVAHARIKKQVHNVHCLEAEIEYIKQDVVPQGKEFQAMMNRAKDLFTDYVRSSKNLPAEVVTALDGITDEYHKVYYIGANINSSVENKQKILNSRSITEQYLELNTLLSGELELLKLEEEIDVKVNDSIQKNQRKYFIQEQIRALQKELGEDDEFMGGSDSTNFRKLIDEAGMPEHVLAKANEEYERLRKTPTMSPEYGVSRTYLEWLTALPWNQTTNDNLNIENVHSVLDADHYDLEKPKERILEYISVLNLTNSTRGQILCFVGPPGVGKTSLASSIARALGRKFVRISLGGIRDEAEIRGHRRTYIGSMPGKIIQSMKRAGTINPVILLDEVDKMSSDFRGDPSAAMLEVLDPEQNHAFNDHFVEVDYDLSKVLFIATANVKYDIPLPLLDRMEVIELNSYLDIDKLEIAKRHIVPKQIEAVGLHDFNVKFTDDAILKIIREYTREAGVRQLERELSGVLRKIAKDIVTEIGNANEKTSTTTTTLRETSSFKKIANKRKVVIDVQLVDKLLKAPKFKSKAGELSDKIGVVTGLAWTSVGGDTLPVEVTIMPGSEKLTLTGKLGDVMKESAQAALSYVRANAELYGIDSEFTKGKEIHIHVPEGAIPKDGPSAGITMTMGLLSAASGKAIRGDVAMTGEVTLRGNILPIGGLNEKLLAAKRYGVIEVIVPKDNEKDIEDISPQVKEGLKIHFVSTVQEAIPFVFKDKLATIPTKANSTTKKHATV